MTPEAFMANCEELEFRDTRDDLNRLILRITFPKQGTEGTVEPRQRVR